MKTFEDLKEALNRYRSEGYTVDFNIAFDKLICQETGLCLSPEDFRIKQTVRFDPTNEPGEESILFLIESLDGKMKGALVSGSGSSSNKVSPELLEKIQFNNKAPGL